MAEQSDADLPGGIQKFIRLFVIALIVLSVLTSAALLRSDGVTLNTVSSVFVNLYVAGLVFYGIFYNKMNSRPFRIALYGGVILWGVTDLLTGTETTMTYLLILGGGALVTREAFLKN
ncbi:hypothetical protein [Halalkalirubrum salinum]|uniref:hypothetical protein n=1 Tax=Halalkalirubrum salinum TaxID=2563889 RepID=UPI0010FBA6B2|nr:hypothetical protein [Halalkalirubrum salinum]